MNPTVMRDLNRLSMVATRILSTSDIFDIENLTKSGTCGEYAVFLKKKITDQLLPFVAKLSDGTVAEILYQNPRRAIEKERDREEICSQLTSSMLRVIAIIVGCLASIQIARSTGTGILQRGGAMTDVINWFVTAGYISAADVGTTTKGRTFRLTTRHARAGTPIFSLTFGDSRDGLYHATLTAATAPGGPEMPTGGLRVNFTNPIDVPGKPDKILPIRITDTTGIPWMVGILCRDKFETLNSATARGGFVPEDIWEQLFIRATGVTTGGATYYETRDQLNIANEVFNQFRRSNDPRDILRATEQFLINTLGYYPGYVDPTGMGAGAAGVVPAFDAYGRPIPYGMGAPGGIIPRYPGAPITRPYAPPAAPPVPLGAPRPFPVAAVSSLKYEIPLPAGKYITDTLAAFRNAIPTLASPAAVRARTLMSNIAPDRTVYTGVCTDPYWSQVNLGRIYPWLALQFLCIDNWKEMTPDKRDIRGLMSPEWNKFLGEMFDLYNNKFGSRSGPRLTNREGLLGEIKFEGGDKLPICSDPASQRIKRLDLIQAGLTSLHDRYDEHVRAMWDILNSLIVVIRLSESGTEVVRIHPQVFKSGEASKKYIDDKAAGARKVISKFYLDIEQIYLETIQKISPA